MTGHEGWRPGGANTDPPSTALPGTTGTGQARQPGFGRGAAAVGLGRQAGACVGGRAHRDAVGRGGARSCVVAAQPLVAQHQLPMRLRSRKDAKVMQVGIGSGGLRAKAGQAAWQAGS